MECCSDRMDKFFSVLKILLIPATIIIWTSIKFPFSPNNPQTNYELDYNEFVFIALKYRSADRSASKISEIVYFMFYRVVMNAIPCCSMTKIP